MESCKSGERKIKAGLLKNWWGVTSSEEAIGCLEWLKNEGHRKKFNLALKNAPNALSKLQSSGDYGDEYIENLAEALPDLQKRNFLGNELELAQVDVTAWDMGRLVNISRWCYDSGYITDDKAWEYLFFAQRESALCYSDWADFGRAYTIGRALWGGDNDFLTSVMDFIEILLEDEKSPWVMSSLK